MPNQIFGKFAKEYTLDNITTLAIEFNNDPRPHKLNLSIGIILDENEEIYIPASIKKASETAARIQKGYLLPKPPLGWNGETAFLEGLAKLIFGKHTNQLLNNQKLAAISTAGGTQAISVFADSLIKTSKDANKKPPAIALSDPFYPNHKAIFESRGLPIEYYPHLNDQGLFNLTSLLQKINDSQPQTIFLFHGSAHNPTGINVQSNTDWQQIAKLLHQKNMSAFFDLPYVGLDKSTTEDIEPVRILMQENVSVAVAFSLSKIAGLYGERTGALYIPCATTQYALSVTSLFNTLVRIQNSNPPGNGQRIMSELFTNHTLLNQWLHIDTPQISKIIRQRRETLAQHFPNPISKTLLAGKGLYALLPINKKGIEYLKNEHAIYLVSNDENHARINLGGATTQQLKQAATTLSHMLTTKIIPL